MLRTILLPGLGADAGLFDPQRQALGEALVCITPTHADAGCREGDPTLDASFGEAAGRIAARLEAEGLFDEPYALGGMSFGGSLAMEIARAASRPPARLMLIASNRTSDTIPARFRLARTLGSFAPRSLAPATLRRLARFFAWREGLDEAGAAWLAGIAERVDVPLLLWGARAVAGWRFTDADAASVGVPIHQIHGARDWVLPIAPRHVTQTLPDARHLINRTHAAEVNAWLGDPGG